MISLLVALPMGLLNSACTTPAHRSNAQEQVKKSTPESQALNLDDLILKGKLSSIEIDYILGHSHYRLFFHSLEDLVVAQNTVDKQILDKSVIDYKTYIEYLQRALVFVRQTQSHGTSEKSLKSNLTAQDSGTAACRTPFKVTIHLAKETYASRGCRTRDNGALSKLVKQGEFLLYSKI